MHSYALWVGLSLFVLSIVGVAVAVVTALTVAWWSSSGAADALIVAPRVRALFRVVLSSAGRVSATEITATGQEVKRELVDLDRRIADRRLRRHVRAVLQDVDALLVDAPTTLTSNSVSDLYRASFAVNLPRAELLSSEANRGMRAVADLEARAALLVKLGSPVGRHESHRRV